VHVVVPLLAHVQAELQRDFELTALAGADGVVTMPSTPVNEAFLDAAGAQLRVVAQHAVGLDNVDLAGCARRGIVVANTPDVLTAATAELTLALLLSLVRRVTEGDRLIRARQPWEWGPSAMLGTGLQGKLLGIVGLGRIGVAVARLGEALGMRVAYAGRAPKAHPYEYLTLRELLERADVVSLHVPLTAETRHLIGAEELRAMQPSAVLVNTTRGAVVDEAALAAALAAGELAGAALDVYEREPEVHEGLLGLENVVLAPHLGSATEDTRTAMGLLCLEALRAVLLRGEIPKNAVAQ
jgi:glyoxylate reductase